MSQSRFTRAEITAANIEIKEFLANEGYEGLRSVGAGEHAVKIKLRADQERRAAALKARYGDLVDITVGYFPYPMPADRTSVRSDACRWISVAGPTSRQGLQATVSFDSATVRSGNDIHGRVTVTNRGIEPATFHSDCVGAVVLPGTSTVVGTYSGVTNLMGFSATLRPGESDSYGVIFGTASSDASVGYGLPPGNYEAVVPVVVGPSSPPGGALQPLLVTAPAALIVIA